MANKKLYRSANNQVIAGVLAGVAEYFDHDVLLWRILFIAFLLLTGLMPGVLIYVIAWLVIPIEPSIVPLDETDYTVFE